MSFSGTFHRKVGVPRRLRVQGRSRKRTNNTLFPLGGSCTRHRLLRIPELGRSGRASGRSQNPAPGCSRMQDIWSHLLRRSRIVLTDIDHTRYRHTWPQESCGSCRSRRICHKKRSGVNISIKKSECRHPEDELTRPFGKNTILSTIEGLYCVSWQKLRARKNS